MRILENEFDNLAEIMKALGDETRLRILNLLIERECCVCEVIQALDISQTRASRNLSHLFDAGLLEQRKEGLWTIYYLSTGLGADYRKLIIDAVDAALSGNSTAVADRSRLRASSRLCPPGNNSGTRCPEPGLPRSA